MAFVSQNRQVVSFAAYEDVLLKDQRLFEANEGLSDQDLIDSMLIRATERILTNLRSSPWWQSYYINRNTSVVITSVADVPALDPSRIRARQNDFTDLCIYTALGEYILPSIADFSNEDSAERQKMGYYVGKAEKLFGELIQAGDWYDFDNDTIITSNEKQPGVYNPKRVR